MPPTSSPVVVESNDSILFTGIKITAYCKTQMGPIEKNMFHVFIVAPLFLYVGFARNSTPTIIFDLLGILGLGILVYHLYRAYEQLKNNQSAWINWIHIFLIVPLLLILGYLKQDAAPRYFEMLLLLGFSALGYHGAYLIKDRVLA
jgi:hypothetical protein